MRHEDAPPRHTPSGYAAERRPRRRAGKHALDSFFDDEFGLFLEVLRRSGYPHAPGIARMADILLVRKLVAGQLHLLGVDNDDVVATIRREE